MNKETAIQKVKNSVGSLFTKDDVISIIKSIDGGANVNLLALYSRIESIIDEADSDDITADTSDCEFEIEGSNRIEISESSILFDTTIYDNSIKEGIKELLEAIEEDCDDCQVEEEEDCQ